MFLCYYFISFHVRYLYVNELKYCQKISIANLPFDSICTSMLLGFFFFSSLRLCFIIVLNRVLNDRRTEGEVGAVKIMFSLSVVYSWPNVGMLVRKITFANPKQTHHSPTTIHKVERVGRDSV